MVERPKGIRSALAERWGPASRAWALLRRLDGWLLLAVALGAWLRFARLGDFHNAYYTATTASMLTSAKNFFFGSFDSGGVVTVDKPPAAFWLDSIPAAIWGVKAWTVALPQVLMGIAAILVLYLAIKPAFGRMAAAASALLLAAIPASVVIDSRNEPDALLSFTLLLAATSIVRAARTGKWQWHGAFALLMGIAFNTKMLVAFLPLPAFLLYYALAVNLPLRRAAFRMATATIVLVVFSFSWATAVALTPAEERPYIGSTRDNSIWTLIFKYNGLDRFGGFGGPRLTAPQQQQPGPPQGGLPGGPSQPGQPPLGAGAGQQPPGPPGPGNAARDFFALFGNSLASQLGWLLPIGIFASLVCLVPLFTERVFRRPSSFLAHVRGSPRASEGVLWAGWFGTAVVVFGIAAATNTHPYYLVGAAVPLAAVGGIALASLFGAFHAGGALAWLLPAALAVGGIYVAVAARGAAHDWVVAIAFAAALLAGVPLAIAAWRRLTDTRLAGWAAVAGALALLLVPASLGYEAGGRIAAPGPLPGQPGRPPEAPWGEAVAAYIRSKGDAGSRFAVGAFSARETAPFIIEGTPAVAIGGFSGNDPIFTLERFRSMVAAGELRYFLFQPGSVPGLPTGGPQGQVERQRIATFIRTEWRDMSLEAGLPQGTLWRYGR
ncbi:MAG: glycosyltransferase family 39 protein [Chloroflexi bacterium]|nr:glycosyltransferase family 39 protein [Chloroflexota bacterium]